MVFLLATSLQILLLMESSPVSFQQSRPDAAAPVKSSGKSHANHIQMSTLGLIKLIRLLYKC